MRNTIKHHFNFIANFLYTKDDNKFVRKFVVSTSVIMNQNKQCIEKGFSAQKVITYLFAKRISLVSKKYNNIEI